MKLSKVILAFALVLGLASCREKKENEWDNSSANDNATAENYFNDLFKTVDDVAGATEGIREYEMGCIDTVMVDTTSNPRTITIDFGQDDCVGYDGRIRKGQIYVTFTGKYRDEGTIITITPIDYTVNGYALSGTKQITNMGLNADDDMYFHITVVGSVTAPGNAYTIEWESDRTRTWTGGEETLTIWDDTYEITGDGSGVNKFGIPFTVEIVSALRIEIGCPWIVSGEIEVTPDDGTVRLIDFGNGNCNNGFSITVNGTVFNFGNEV